MSQRSARIEKSCEICGIVMSVTIAKSSRRFCSKVCANKNLMIIFAGNGNPAHGKTYKTKATHPEWVAQIVKTQQQSDRMRGANNPMKRPDVAQRMAKTRRQRVTSDPKYREARSTYMRLAWATGKYDGVAVGKCKWYDHVRPDGSIVKLQGTWEVVFARHLDANGIEYDAHRGRIPYLDPQGNERSYYPDFYVACEDQYYDIKGAYFDDVQADKLNLVRSSNPTINIKVINRLAFTDMGIDVIKEGNNIR